MTKSVPGYSRVVLSLMAVSILASTSSCTPSIEKLWDYPIGSPIYSTPLVTDRYIIFGSESGVLNAVDKNGQARWQFQAASAEIFAHPVSDGKLVYFGATNQKFYAVDMKGQLRWQFAASERIKSDPTLVEGIVYVTSYDGHVYALKAGTGSKIWQFPPAEAPKPEEATEDTGDEKEESKASEEPAPATEPSPKPQAFSYAAPVIKDGVLYVGNLDGYLYALNTSDGSLKWRFQSGGGVTSTAWVEDGVVYFGSKDDQVYALDAQSGEKVLWTFKTGGDVLSSPILVDGTLYIGSNDKNFYAINAKDGQVKCKFQAKGPIVSFGAVYKNLVFFGAGQGDGSIYGIDRNSCKLFFSHRTGYKIESDPVMEGDRLYLTSGDRKLYAFKINKTE